MNWLSPSILAADFNRLGEQIRIVQDCGSQALHFDVMDGLFVPSISFGMPVLASIRKETDLFLDVHLMIREPVRYIREFTESGADLITVHYEACSDVAATLRAIREAGVKVGMSIRPETPVSVLRPFVKSLDLILIMSVNPGFGGQKFIENTIGKVIRLREMIASKGSHALIEVDGGVQDETAPRLVSTGVDVLVSGSYVFKAKDPIATIHDLKALG